MSEIITAKTKIYSVSELNNTVLEMLEENFSDVWVEGEVSNFRGVASSGHCYFTIKDERSQLSTVAFRGVMQSLKFQLQEGLKVLVRGRASMYPQRGNYQLIASWIEPQGAGALQMAFEQLKKKLAAEGLFDAQKKRAIPPFPQKIGIVTSPTGAAIRDILTVIDRRFANVEILIYPTKVQGEGAKEEIAAGVAYLNAQHPELEVLLVGRGGGSVEDLWAFNEEVVARAIAESQIPVISCVGHEIDFTIADFVADLRAPTPSAAAELVVKNKSEILQNVTAVQTALVRAMQKQILLAQEKISAMLNRGPFKRPEQMYEILSQRLDTAAGQLHSAWEENAHRIEQKAHLLGSKLALLSPQNILREKTAALEPYFHRLQALAQKNIQQAQNALQIKMSQLHALSPLAVLGRGYALATNAETQELIRNSRQVKPGQALRVRVQQGEIIATVKETL